MIRKTSLGLAVILIVFGFYPLPASGARYLWPILDTSHDPVMPIAGTISEVRTYSRDHLHGAIDIARTQGTEIVSVSSSTRDIHIAVMNDEYQNNRVNIGRFDYRHIRVHQKFVDGVDGFDPETEVDPGEVFAQVGNTANDHLHFEETVSDYGDAGGHPELTRLDPLRSLRGEDGGFFPEINIEGATFRLEDNRDPVIRAAGLIHNAGDTTANWQPFPQLSAENPEEGPRIHRDNEGNVQNADYDDTWVVWGPVEAWADAYDPRVNDSVDRTLGVYSLASDFSFSLEGDYYEYREGPPEVEIEGTLAEYLGDSFAYQTFDTVPGAVSVSRQQLVQHAFRDGSRISPTSFYYLLHNNPHGSQDVTGDYQHPYEGMNRFWNTAEGIFDPEDNPNTSPLDMTLFAKYPDGSYNWEVTATDVVGNTAVHQQQVVVDNMLAVPVVDGINADASSRWNNVASDLEFSFNSDRSGIILCKPDRNKSAIKYSDPSAGPFEVLLPANPADNSYISYSFSEPVKYTVVVDGDTLLERGKIQSDRITWSSIDFGYDAEYENWPSPPDADVSGWESFHGYEGNIFNLSSHPSSRILKLSGVDHANNPLDYSPGTFSRRDNNGDFTDVSSRQYFEIKYYFDYSDPEIHDLSVNADYDVSVEVSDNSNSNFFTDGIQAGRLYVLWSVGRYWHWGSYYVYRSEENLNLSGSTPLHAYFNGDFTPRWLTVFVSDASGRSTFQRYRISNDKLIPHSTMSVSGDSKSFLQLKKVSMLDYLLKMKEKGETKSQDLEWNLENISEEKAEYYSEEALGFYVEEKENELVVTPYFKNGAEIDEEIGETGAEPQILSSRDAKSDSQSTVVDIDAASRVEIISPSDGGLSGKYLDVVVEAVGEVKYVTLQRRYDERNQFRPVRSQAVPASGNRVRFRDIRADERRGLVQFRAFGTILTGGDNIKTGYSETVTLKREKIGGVELTSDLQQRLEAGKVKGYAVDPDFGAMFISGLSAMGEEASEPAFDPSRGEFLAVDNPNMIDGTLQAFTVSGEKVYEESVSGANVTRLEWRGRNQAGAMIKNGVYIVRVKITSRLPGEPPKSTVKSFPVMVVK